MCSFWMRCGIGRTPLIRRWRKSLESVKELAPRRAFFTHISHDLPHAETEAAFPPNVRLAYDGLQLEVPLPQLEVRG